jgi:hypothetical protein
MAKVQKEKREWKTRTEGKKRYMICQNSEPDGKYWQGQICNEWSAVGERTTASLCWKCTMSLCAAPEVGSGYKSSGKPRGWQFMKEFVDEQGNVYHKGIEQPSLKGTLPTTTIEASDKKKLSKREKEELKDQILLQIAMLRGEVKKATLKKDINTGTKKLRKLERQLKKVQ